MTLAHCYRTTHVPVGEDQVQHLEFARHCAEHFNMVYGDIFIKPQTVLCKSVHSNCEAYGSYFVSTRTARDVSQGAASQDVKVTLGPSLTHTYQ